MKGKPKPTFLFVSFGAEWGLTSVDFLEGKTNSSSSDAHSSSGSGRILTSRNLLLLREKKMPLDEELAMYYKLTIPSYRIFFGSYLLKLQSRCSKARRFKTNSELN